jgi:CRISPR-associated endonuclease/helicase Cas3
MNVLLISQCTKNALTETRRILDQFAERRGDRTWQTPITQAGLDTLYRLLRKTARKNTAVACHWIRGKDHSELLWVVGDARQFNESGATPTNLTRRNVLRGEDENDWHSAEDIRSLARLAALFHDLGKASDSFQDKLRKEAQADPYRHEWVSLRLFEAFVGSGCPDDRDCLQRLTQLDGSETTAVLSHLIKDGTSERTFSPFKSRTPELPLARVVGWLIVSHHRLPTPNDKLPEDQRWALSDSKLNRLPNAITHDWCGSRCAPRCDTSTRAEIKAFEKAQTGCWEFSRGLPFESAHWREHIRKSASALLSRPTLLDTGADERLASPYLLHLARLTLMLADHHYSSLETQARYGDPATGTRKTLYANTRRDHDNDARQLNQRLDEHLIGVGVSASRLMHALPRLANTLPRIARHRGFRARASGDFRWQNKAFDLAESLRESTARHGFFGVNLASTGRGKTMANARILYALADPRTGARFTVALGLRTLTLQTGDAYRERLSLGYEDLAVLVGGAATRTLHEYHRKQEEQANDSAGSESARGLLPAHNHVRYEGSLEEGPLKRWLQSPRQGRGAPPSALLDAPVLVCTIDHLMPATESTRGGHQILPMLRLMTSDLVIDEPDDFDVADLPALSRLVNWAGLLGSRVLISSATLPPALVQGLYLAYRAGRAEFQRHRGEPGTPLAICCAWFDEFGTHAAQHATDEAGHHFLASHDQFIDRRIARLAAQRDKGVRRGTLRPVSISPTTHNDTAGKRAHICTELAGQLRESALELHRAHHVTDPVTGKRISFGLIRMANIDALFDTAQALYRQGAPDGSHIHLCVYHARHPVMIRANMERTLDTVLRRHQPEAVFQHPTIRRALDDHTEADQLFIVLATAVAEVGRDHDYDWAIVEPSSMRSIIQLAGRVQRHRDNRCPPEHPNILLLDTNIKALMNNGSGPAFWRPGFESPGFRLASHKLSELLAPEQWQVIDAAPRIRPRMPPHWQQNLADLEHHVLADLMLGAQPGEHQGRAPVHWWWSTRAHLSGVLQTRQRFRADPLGHRTYALLPDEDGNRLILHLFGDNGTMAPVSNLLHAVPDGELFTGERITPWATPAALETLETLANDLDMTPIECALRFATVDLPGNSAQQVWRHHPVLGFSRRQG